jgi:hypothetical protein
MHNLSVLLLLLLLLTTSCNNQIQCTATLKALKPAHPHPEPITTVTTMFFNQL